MPSPPSRSFSRATACDIALLAIANFVDLKSPYTLGHAGAVADLAADTGAQLGLSEGEIRTLRRAGPRARPGAARHLERDLGQAGAARRRRMGARATPPVPDRAHAAPVTVALTARGDRRPASRTARRLGLSAGALGRGDLPPRAHPRRGRRLPGDARAAAVPRGPLGRGRGRRASRRRAGGAPRRRGRRGGAGRGRAPRDPAPRGAGRADPARGRGARPARPRALEQADRAPARHLAEDGRQPHRAHLFEDRRLLAGPCEPVRDAARAAAGGATWSPPDPAKDGANAS